MKRWGMCGVVVALALGSLACGGRQAETLTAIDAQWRAAGTLADRWKAYERMKGEFELTSYEQDVYMPAHERSLEIRRSLHDELGPLVEAAAADRRLATVTALTMMRTRLVGGEENLGTSTLSVSAEHHFDSHRGVEGRALVAFCSAVIPVIRSKAAGDFDTVNVAQDEPEAMLGATLPKLGVAFGDVTGWLDYVAAHGGAQLTLTQLTDVTGEPAFTLSKQLFFARTGAYTTPAWAAWKKTRDRLDAELAAAKGEAEGARPRVVTSPSMEAVGVRRGSQESTFDSNTGVETITYVQTTETRYVYGDKKIQKGNAESYSKALGVVDRLEADLEAHLAKEPALKWDNDEEPHYYRNDQHFVGRLERVFELTGLEQPRHFAQTWDVDRTYTWFEGVGKRGDSFLMSDRAEVNLGWNTKGYWDHNLRKPRGRWWIVKQERPAMDEALVAWLVAQIGKLKRELYAKQGAKGTPAQLAADEAWLAYLLGEAEAGPDGLTIPVRAPADGIFPSQWQ